MKRKKVNHFSGQTSLYCMEIQDGWCAIRARAEMESRDEGWDGLPACRDRGRKGSSGGFSGKWIFLVDGGDACPDTAACGSGDLPVQMLSVQEKDSPAAAWRGQQSLLRMAAFQAEKLCGGIGSGKGQRKFWKCRTFFWKMTVLYK